MNQLVDRLREQGFFRTAQVEQSFRAVPRHQFVPGVPLATAYSEEAIVTRRNQQGLPTSSSSMPAIMAVMIEQLDVHPGQRIMEIGAGTGYNAALLAHLVGPAGRVVTIETDADVAEEAKEHLSEAGFGQVQVRIGDGWLGSPEDAPFDKIEATVGMWDLSPHWVEQVRDGGILVLPFWLRAGLQVSVALRKEKEDLRSVSVEPCGFMRLRGPHKGPEEYVRVGEWSLSADETSTTSERILAEILQTAPQVESASGLPSGWRTAFLLNEPQAVILSHNEDWRRGIIGIFDVNTRSLAGVEGRMGEDESRIVVFGKRHARQLFEDALVRAVKVELRDLRIRAFPRSVQVNPPEHEWFIERPSFKFVINRV